MSERVPEELADHPATDALVWIILSRRGPTDFGDLREHTRLPESTLSDALHRLVDAGYVQKDQCLGDSRKTLYDPAKSLRDSE